METQAKREKSADAIMFLFLIVPLIGRGGLLLARRLNLMLSPCDSTPPMPHRGTRSRSRCSLPSQPIADGILCTALIVHSHLGFDQCLIDYVHPRKFPVLGPLGKWALRGATALSVYGVYEFETNDVGACRCGFAGRRRERQG